MPRLSTPCRLALRPRSTFAPLTSVAQVASMSRELLGESADARREQLEWRVRDGGADHHSLRKGASAPGRAELEDGRTAEATRWPEVGLFRLAHELLRHLSPELRELNRLVRVRARVGILQGVLHLAHAGVERAQPRRESRGRAVECRWAFLRAEWRQPARCHGRPVMAVARSEAVGRLVE